MLILSCYQCHKEIDEPGALIFSPPTWDDNVYKYHLCSDCFEGIINLIYAARQALEKDRI